MTLIWVFVALLSNCFFVHKRRFRFICNVYRVNTSATVPSVSWLQVSWFCHCMWLLLCRKSCLLHNMIACKLHLLQNLGECTETLIGLRNRSNWVCYLAFCHTSSTSMLISILNRREYCSVRYKNYSGLRNPLYNSTIEPSSAFWLISSK